MNYEYDTGERDELLAEKRWAKRQLNHYLDHPDPRDPEYEDLHLPEDTASGQPEHSPRGTL